MARQRPEPDRRAGVRNPSLPNPFPDAATTLAFLLAASAVNVSAFAFGLFERIFWIDKALHAFTGFAVTLPVLCLLRGRLNDAASRYPWVTVAASVSFGLAIGLAWEAMEWLGDSLYGLDLIKGAADTVTDLVMDALGAAAAGIAADSARTRASGLNRQN
jgi:hypothetical protein